MVTLTSSRFVGLKIEDDEDEYRKPKQKSKPAASGAKQQQQSVKNGVAGSKQTAQQQQKKQKPKAAKNKTLNEADQKEQWSQWQQKDSELLEKSYMTDLEQALLQSKLDFEANKTRYEEAEKTEASKQQLAGKSKKAKTFSLHEFQEKVEKDIKQKEQQRQRRQAEEEYNKSYTFFEQIDLETKQIINKEQMKALFQTKALSGVTKNGKEASRKKGKGTAPEPASELDLLKAENTTLKEELTVLRSRFKKIASVLASAEMKEKGQLLLEIDQLKKAQEDMTTEMTELYGELEQAKSRSNQDAKSKERGKSRKSGHFGSGPEPAAANCSN
ncbi:G kinase-anchoring protein 1-like [Anopheles cruzii]|uniref:G kinase-anchoring protein 1-like n=1 Tax=Anopheles cruzii TaxID=68878 RepID=UPI0022EC519C|nr:G kinase-anchoring protein 1-like [Anopheles cruzii]